MASTVLPAMSTARNSGARFSAAICPVRVGVSGQVISSGATAATSGSAGAGTAAVTRPAPARKAARAAMAGAPDFPPARAEATRQPRARGRSCLCWPPRRGGLCKRERRACPVEFERGNDGCIGRADGRDHDGLVPTPRQLAEDVRRLGRGKGDDGIGGEDRAGDVAAVSSAGQPEGRSTARMGAAVVPIHSSAASASPLSGGLKPVPSTASTIRSVCKARLVPAQIVRNRDHVDAPVRRAGQLAPACGRIAGELARARPAAAWLLRGRRRQAGARPSCRRRRCCRGRRAP